MTAFFTLRLTGVEPARALLSPSHSEAKIIVAASDFPFGQFEFDSRAPLVISEEAARTEVVVLRRGGRVGKVPYYFLEVGSSATQ